MAGKARPGPLIDQPSLCNEFVRDLGGRFEVGAEASGHEIGIIRGEQEVAHEAGLLPREVGAGLHVLHDDDPLTVRPLGRAARVVTARARVSPVSVETGVGWAGPR